MQFGRALQRVLTTIVHANARYGPVYMAKIDIADGFYRVWVAIHDVPKLGVALPVSPGSVPLVAFPLALPMGWIDSPPYFTSVTETICDEANSLLSQPGDLRLQYPHHLEAVAATPPMENAGTQLPTPVHVLPPSPHGGATCTKMPVAAVDVYVGDFLLLAQTRHQQQRVVRASLHSIDGVLRPLGDSDPPERKEPASVKKMLKGDVHWSPQKRMLGWDIDSSDLTLNLPPHRVARCREVLAWLTPPRRRLPTAQWHQLLGELRSMSPALPGTCGLFSVLQQALSRGDSKRVRLNQHVYDTAADFTHLLDSLARRPHRLHELVPTLPIAIGASDACQRGMGGVWLDAHSRSPPIVWRQAFAPHVSADMVSDRNPRGSLSISDLELTAIIAHKDILAHARDVRERTIWIASDNQAAEHGPRRVPALRWQPGPISCATMPCISAATVIWPATITFQAPSTRWPTTPVAGGI